jgi:hypothetical protein
VGFGVLALAGVAGLVEDWEAAAAPAIEAGIRTAFARTGLVVSPDGGAWGKLLPIFKLGGGGKLDDDAMVQALRNLPVITLVIEPICINNCTTRSFGTQIGNSFGTLSLIVSEPLSLSVLEENNDVLTLVTRMNLREATTIKLQPGNYILVYKPAKSSKTESTKAVKVLLEESRYQVVSLK